MITQFTWAVIGSVGPGSQARGSASLRSQYDPPGLTHAAFQVQSTLQWLSAVRGLDEEGCRRGYALCANVCCRGKVPWWWYKQAGPVLRGVDNMFFRVKAMPSSMIPLDLCRHLNLCVGLAAKHLYHMENVWRLAFCAGTDSVRRIMLALPSACNLPNEVGWTAPPSIITSYWRT